MATTDPRPAPEKLREDLIQLRDEIKLKVHLAGMDARARWKAIEPRLRKIQGDIDDGFQDAGDEIVDVAVELRADMKKLWKSLGG